MKKRFLLLFVVIVLTACSHKKIRYDYTFRGEGEHWKVEYSISGTETVKEEGGITTGHSNESRDELVLTYKGELKALSPMRFLEYSYETSIGGGNGKREFHEPPTEMIFTFAEGVGDRKVIETDEVIQITIRWNGYEESLDLQNASSSSIKLNSSMK